MEDLRTWNQIKKGPPRPLWYDEIMAGPTSEGPVGKNQNPPKDRFKLTVNVDRPRILRRLADKLKAHPEGATETEAAYDPVVVDLGGGQQGHEIKDAGDSFDLANMFSADAGILGADKFSEVYFRTSSGNLYVLNDYGVLVDAKESQRRGSPFAQEVPIELLEKQKLEIGKSFHYGAGGNTTRVTEIVPTNRRIYHGANESLKKNNIKTDFTDRVPGYRYQPIHRA